MRQVFWIALTFTLTLAACSSKDLSRSSAADIIKQTNAYPKQITDIVRTGNDFMVGGSYRDYEEHIIPQLNEFGLAEASYKSGPPVGKATVKLTKKSDEYIISKSPEMESRFFNIISRYQDVTVLTYTCNLGEVTGIAYLNEQKTLARVEYTQVCDPTPFGKMRNYSRNYLDNEAKMNITLMLYDDGWREMK